MLDEAARVGADFVMLQETRHWDKCCWASKVAELRGWRATFSPSPPRGRGQSGPRQGGTAVLWRTDARSASFQVELPEALRHRVCGRVFSNFALVSFYGPADTADPNLLSAVLRAASELNRPTFLLGDFNWKGRYEQLLGPSGARQFPVVPTVLRSQASPSRGLVLGDIGLDSASVSTSALPGIPHHKAVCFRGAVLPNNSFPEPACRTRFKRTSVFEWLIPDKIPDEYTQQLRQASDALTAGPGLDLASRFQCWHRKAEACCEVAVQLGLATKTRAAERPKGSQPTGRRCCQGPSVRQAEPVALRRWKRLHRAALEQARRHGGNAALTVSQARHWHAILPSGGSLPLTQDEALERASGYIALEETAASRARKAQWRRQFTVSLTEATRAASTVLKPQPCPDPNVDSRSMCAEWEPRWTAQLQAPGQAWQSVLQRAGVQPTPPGDFANVSVEEMRTAISEGAGGAGFDGWTAKELRGLCTSCAWLVDDLVSLFNETLQHQSPEVLQACRDSVFAWRVVGIPKRTEAATRPIAVASSLVRAFNRAILKRCPEPPEGQQCGVSGQSAVTATLQWLAVRAQRGAELDLRRAFDTIDHRLAGCAASTYGVHPVVIRYLQQLVWCAPRSCVVGGEPPPRSIQATCGLPQGDPVSPLFLSFVLGPWFKIVCALPAISAFLYMDDRSLLDSGDRNSLEPALRLTEWHDHTLGLQEHLGKRQQWAIDGSYAARAVEHLGLTATPGVDVLPSTRAGPDDLKALASQLQYLPGAMEMKERLLAAFILPKISWAAPLIPAVEFSIVRSCFRAIRGHVTWWCQGRVWADCINLHPLFAACFRCLLQAEGPYSSLPNRTLAACVQHAADCLQLTVCDGPGFWLQPAPGADRRIVQAAANAARASRVRRGTTFKPTADAGHTLRVAARVQALSTCNRDRLDAEGVDDVDVQAQSHCLWKRWKASLNKLERSKLAVWRGGATRTRTRRHFQGHRVQLSRNPRLCACEWCPHPASSARHLFAECPRLQAERTAITAELGLAPNWFSSLPRVTCKTGWVCISASPDPEIRVKIQIASCRLGICIAELGVTVPDF